MSAETHPPETPAVGRGEAARWELVVGLEVHVQLRTRAKLFCPCEPEFGARPNTRVCPVCLGLPGALPVVNMEAVELALRTGAAFGCTLHPVSVFARKNYFYPDLPKGYQISQFERPIATDGTLATDEGRPIRIRRIHMEEDAGKSIHDRFADATAVDLNRTGTPLVEIVTEPDFREATEARGWLQRLKQVLEYLEVSDCNMEEGSLRVDANLSLRPVGSEGLGTKTEVKNMNSFSAVERAIDAEAERQRGLLEAGERVISATLLWDEGRGEVRLMRSKEESLDYRYFPDPDLPPLVLDPARLDEVGAALPELPDLRRKRFVVSLGLPAYDAGVLTATREVANWYEGVVAAGADPKEASNWVMGAVLAAAKEREGGVASLLVSPAALARLIALVTEGAVSRNGAKAVLERMLETGEEPDPALDALGLRQVRDEGALEGWVAEVMAECPDEVARFRGGEKRLHGFLMGEVMKRSRGKADPKAVAKLLAEALSGE